MSPYCPTLPCVHIVLLCVHIVLLYVHIVLSCIHIVLCVHILLLCVHIVLLCVYIVLLCVHIVLLCVHIVVWIWDIRSYTQGERQLKVLIGAQHNFEKVRNRNIKFKTNITIFLYCLPCLSVVFLIVVWFLNKLPL